MTFSVATTMRKYVCLYAIDDLSTSEVTYFFNFKGMRQQLLHTATCCEGQTGSATGAQYSYEISK